jgi:hypothetical protein
MCLQTVHIKDLWCICFRICSVIRPSFVHLHTCVCCNVTVLITFSISMIDRHSACFFFFSIWKILDSYELSYFQVNSFLIFFMVSLEVVLDIDTWNWQIYREVMVTGNSLLCGSYGLLEYDIYSLVDKYHYCQESAASICRAECSTALGSTETLLLTYQSTCTHIPDNDINLLTPNVNYSGCTTTLTSKVAFYIFIQQM